MPEGEEEHSDEPLSSEVSGTQPPGNQLDLSSLGFNPEELVKQLFDNVNFGGPDPGGNLPPELVSVFFRAVRMYSGPLPPPEIMAAYKDIDPTFPERMFALAEKQSDHRMTLETSKLTNDGTNERLGLLVGPVLVLGALVCGTIIILSGKSWFGFGIVLVAAVGLAAVYRADLKRIKLSLGKKAKVSVRASGDPGGAMETQPKS